ncbi:MAG TPA: Fic family protein [Caldilineaceae bacterium]|nr:Fic family protein [Caldilineaceae bacterium]
MLEARLLQRIDEKKRRLDQLRPLPLSAVQRLQEQLMVEWIYHSNAIEGNTLTLRETQLILQTGLTIGGKSLREHFEVINHREAITFVEALVAQGEAVTPFQVRQIHALVLKGIDDENAGHYRQLPVRIIGALYQPPEAWEVPRLITEWGDWLEGAAKQLHPVEQASLAHHQLAAIHPFIDGNGRTARLVMNLLLLKDGFPPTIIRKENRRQYYRLLAQADVGKVQPFVNFVGREVDRSLTLYLEACTPQLVAPAAVDRWITLREAAEGTPYSQEYLSLLPRTGRLEATKRGRSWYTTKRAVADYQRSTKS